MDVDSLECRTLPNPSGEASGGAGVNTAQALLEKDVQAVVVGSIGPKAMHVLKAAGISILTGLGTTVGDTMDRYKNGELAQYSDTAGGSSKKS